MTHAEFYAAICRAADEARAPGNVQAEVNVIRRKPRPSIVGPRRAVDIEWQAYVSEDADGEHVIASGESPEEVLIDFRRALHLEPEAPTADPETLGDVALEVAS